jgi:hypothetical protein
MKSDSEPVRENNQTPDTSRETDVQAHHSNPDIPSTPSVSSSPPSKTHCQITYKIEKDWWDKTKPFVEIAGLVLLLIYTAYTIKIYRANAKAANAAKSAADTARDTLIASQRAWVGMKGFFLPVKVLPNVPLSASYGQVNFGHGPALSVGNRAAFGVLEQELTVEQAETRLATAKSPNTYTMFPSEETPAGQASVTINNYWLGRVNNGKAWLYYFGDTVYRDEFKAVHRTTFCSVYNPAAKQFQYCEIYNDAD